MNTQENEPKSNPFYNNYVFTEKDLKRAKIRWWELPLFLWFTKTYAQTAVDNEFGAVERNRYIFYYKVWGAKYYLIKIKNQKLVADGDLVGTATSTGVI